MSKQPFNNRKVDHMPLNKSKQYLWKYIQRKTGSAKKPGSEPISEKTGGVGMGAGWNFTILLKRLIPVSVVAVILIVALVFSSNLRGLIDKDGDLKVPTVYASFEMTANDEDGSGIASDSTFTLKASEDLSEEIIEETLNVTPAVDLEITKSGDGLYEVSPKAEFEANQVYNFSIASESGDFSWTYQVQDTFKIIGTLPADKATYVPINTGIEFYFSHEDFDFDRIEKYFEILPTVKGRFEHHRRTLSFVAEEELKKGTIYTVTLKKGLALNNSEQSLSEDYLFQFETDDQDYSYNNYSYLTFVQPYYEVATDSTIALDVYGYYNYNYDYESADAARDFEVNVYQYADLEAYTDALKKRFEVPEWCYFTKALYKHPKEGLTEVGTFEALTDQINWTTYVYLPDAVLKEGYYLFEVEAYGKTSQALVQITDLSSYLNISLTDTLIWVNDLKTGKPVKDAEVAIERLSTGGADDAGNSAGAGSGDSATYLTDENGIARFETPQEWKQEFYSRASDLIKITAPDGKVLVNEIAPYYDSYMDLQYWHSFSTDRSTYLPTDTIKFWGFIKPKRAGTDNENLTMELVYNWDTFVAEVPLKLENDNTFLGEVEFKNLTPGYYYLAIKKGEATLYNHSIEIADYVKPAYNLTVDTDKKAVFAGEDINFTIKTNFFDGTPLPGLDLEYYTSETGNKQLQTDAKGEAKLNFVAPFSGCDESYGYDYYYYCYDISNFYMDVNSSLAEETDLWAYGDVRVFNSRLTLAGRADLKEDKATVSIKTNWVDLTKINSSEEESYYDYIGKVAPNRKVNGNVKELWWEAVEDGEYYDFINKKVVKQYRYEQRSKVLPSFTVETDRNGDGFYEFNVNPDKYYQIALTSNDDEGKTAHESMYAYGYDSQSYDYTNYQIKILNGEESKSQDWWMWEFRSFDIGEKVEAVFSDGEVPVKEDESEDLERVGDQKFLFLQLSNGLQQYSIQDSPYYSFEFEKEDVPNVYVDGIWFDGHKYIDAYEQSVNYKKELSSLDVEIEADKESYNPGEEVSLTVKVTDKDNSPAKAKVNLNLVDEAYYKVAYDNFTDPLDDLYINNPTGVLETYDTHDNPLGIKAAAEGMGGCFTGETKILMADGSYKAIKDIRKGDFIMTKKQEYSSELVAAEVTNTVSHFVSEYLVINENLEVTPVHIVFVNGKWDTAGNVKVGDFLHGKNGEEIEVVSIRRVVEPVWVYNFEVKGKHTYFANDFYVHNDKGGGGEVYVRSDFKDTAFFGVVETGIDGEGEISFKLPDNITSWRVTAKAIDTENLKAGTGKAAIKVSQPFFADLIMNGEYSIKDSPTIKFRAYGDELEEGDRVDFTVTAESLGVKEDEPVVGKAFEGSYYELPPLSLGEHDITVYAESEGSGGEKLEDALQKTIEVKGSRLKKDIVEFIRKVDDKTAFDLSKENPTEIRFLDGGIAYYYSTLYHLYYTNGDRLDQRLSRIMAAELLNQYFGDEEGYDEWQADDEDLTNNYQKEGLTLLPYSEPDLKLSAVTLYSENNRERWGTLALREYFYTTYKSVDANLEEVVLSLLGLASLNEPVLTSLRTIQNEPSLTLEEKLYIGLAFEALGSVKDAKAIYEEIYPKLAGDKDTVFATALGAVLAAGLDRGQQAADLWDFVEDIGFEDDLTNLYQLAYIKNSLEYADSKPVKFKVKVGDHTENVELDLWESFSLMAHPDDIVAVSVIEGDLAANMYYADTITPEEFEKNRTVSIERTYYVDGVETTEFRERDLIEVVLRPRYNGDLQFPYFQVTDILPSGLTNITNPAGRSYSYYLPGYTYPYKVQGQEMTFYWYDDPYEKLDEIRYFARVVSLGEFYAEPAIIQAYDDPSVANISEEATVTIEKGKQ